MARRLLTTLCLWGIIGSTLYFGKLLGGQILLLLIAMGVVFELSELLKKQKIQMNTQAMMAAVFFVLSGHFWGFASIGTSLGLIFSLVAHAKSELKTIPIALGCLVAVTVGLGSLNAIALPGDSYQIWQTVWVIAVIKLSDGGGYLFGTHFGKRPLLPAISPTKTIEGLMGALLSGTIIGAMGGPLFLDFWFGPLLGITLALTGSVGDMLESLLKRRAGVKDSGNILPGIGGLLDLCDSLILAAPVAWIAIRSLSGMFG